MRNIGKYQVQGELGRGGFGTVYRAWDPVVNRSVAIKVLTVQGDEDLLTRFRNEAAAAGNLHHRNIVTIHDFGEHNGVPYMVMQLLEGNTLQEAVSRHMPFSLIQKMNIMGQVAEGLYHAHLHGVVHRDVKPPNIMILPDESVQIMDFGIARLTASTSRQTRTGFVIGTVLYMAPEQFLPNKIIDHRADIWSYGTIYYEFLTGRHPFAASEETSVLYQIAHVDPPPLSSVAPECPPALEDVLVRLLQKDPDFRYQNLKEVQYDVQPILVDLKREHAQELVAEVRQLTGDGRLEEAQAAAQKILELDPSNREAQSLLQQVRQRLQRRLIQPRINAMLQKAEQEVQSREFRSAIECLESALRLTGTDPAIEGRLGQVRNLLEHSRRAERLIVDAQREMRAQNFTAAFRIASEAAQTDPGNTSASHLISQIQHELDLRERQRQLELGISQARGLLLLQQYDDAITALTTLVSEFPDDATVADLLASARREKQQQELLERRRKEISQVRDTLRQHRFESGITTLEMLLAEFPADPEIKQLLGFARDEWHAHKRAQAISRTRAEADRLCGEARFDDALGEVEHLLAEYPGDASLVRLVQSVTVARAEYEERQRALATRGLLQQANDAERKGDVSTALQILEQGLVEFPEAEALTSAAGRLRLVVAQQERREAIARLVAAIESAMSGGDFPRAFALIENGRRDYRGERVFDGLNARVTSARNAAELEMARARVRQELADGRRDLALELAGVALKRYPNDVQLASLEKEIRAAIAAAEEQVRAEREASERKAREEAEQRAREEAERLAAQQKAEEQRKAREEEERKVREETERKAREEAERIAAEQRAQIEAERKAREEAERRAEEGRKAWEAAERKAREEAERLAAEQKAERRAREEAERLAAIERSERERERKVREELERKAREDGERKAAEQQAHIEAERKARAEAERLAAQERYERERERKVREELERASREQAERLAAKQQADIQAERQARAEAERLVASERAEREKEQKIREDLERKSREEIERIAAEQRAHFDVERKAREQAERQVAEERAERARERKAREELELRSRAEAERVESERKAREDAERLAAEQRAQRDREAREEWEKKAREQAALLAAEGKAQADAERKARQEAERLAAEERQARELLERKAREESERRAAEEKARLEADRKAREESERRAAEHRAQLERERKAREEAEQRAAQERARSEKERRAREEDRRSRRKEVAVPVGGGAAAVPAPVSEPGRKSQLSLYIIGAVIALVVIVAGILIFKPSRPVTNPSETQSEPTQATSPVTNSQPSEARPGSQQTPPLVSGAAKPGTESPKPVTPKPDPPKAAAPPKQDSRQVATRQPEEEPEPAPAATPPAATQPPANPVGDSGPRVIGDSGGRPSVVVTQPPANPPQQAQEKGPWRGKRNGKLSWSGQLPPGEKVVLNMQGVTEGPGQLVNIDLLPGFTDVDITGVRGGNGRISVVTSGPNALVLTNTGSEPATFIEVSWRVRH